MEQLKIEEFLDKAENLLVVDVRSPAEYLAGHIPGAINIPLFDDDERAIVGTLYKQQGRYASVRKGLEITGPKLLKLIDMAGSPGPGGKLLVHCWRGGMRSASMAWLFETAGWKCSILEGGYKSYRRHVRENICAGKELLVLGGYTGSGKTVILHKLREKGEPVVDLEGLACHKGSAFGGIGQGEQPTTEQFENELYRVMSLIREPYCWVEDESLQIGKIFIPDPFYERMVKSRLIFIDVPLEQRINILVADYAGQEPDLLAEAIRRIEKRLGRLAASEAVSSLRSGNFAETAGILLSYYDKTYKYGLGRRDESNIQRLDMRQIPAEKYPDTLISYKNKLLIKNPGSRQ